MCATFSLAATMSFNPRPRAGGDLKPHVRIYGSKTVSIHAPAQGATLLRHQDD